MEKRYSSFFWNALWSADSRATRNTVLSTSTRIFIETLKIDDMELISECLPEWFACHVERKSGNPAALKWFQDHSFLQYANKLIKYLLSFPRRKGNCIPHKWRRNLSYLAYLTTFCFKIPKKYYVTIVTVSHTLTWVELLDNKNGNHHHSCFDAHTKS